MEMITIYREIKDPRREHLKEHSFESYILHSSCSRHRGSKVGMMSPISASGMKIFSVQESPVSRVSLLMTRSTASSPCCPLTNLKKDSAVG